MTVTKQQVSRYTSKLYRFLEDGHDIKFKKLHGLRGWIYKHDNPTVLHLDPRESVISTLVHESLHYFYPDATEAWVLMMEKNLVANLSHRQVTNIIRCLSNNL